MILAPPAVTGSGRAASLREDFQGGEGGVVLEGDEVEEELGLGIGLEAGEFLD